MVDISQSVVVGSVPLGTLYSVLWVGLGAMILSFATRVGRRQPAGRRNRTISISLISSLFKRNRYAVFLKV